MVTVTPSHPCDPAMYAQNHHVFLIDILEVGRTTRNGDIVLPIAGSFYILVELYKDDYRHLYNCTSRGNPLTNNSLDRISRRLILKY